jgi:hypothetical protein
MSSKRTVNAEKVIRETVVRKVMTEMVRFQSEYRIL